MRRQRQLGMLAWIASLAAVLISLWLIWRSLRGDAARETAVPPPPAVAEPVRPVPAATEGVPEITHEERHGLEEVLRRKGAAH
jgi:hypothetical protein